MVGVKLEDATISEVERLATAEDLTWAGKPDMSEMLRRLTYEALAARRMQS